MAAKNTCPQCSSRDFPVFFEIDRVPINIGIQWPSREAALSSPRRDIRLAFCHNCDYIGNLDFSPESLTYKEDYENPLDFSPSFQKYVRTTTERLINLYGLFGKDVSEIGSGKGYFLQLLCDIGDNHGVGFEPSYPSQQIINRISDKITIIKDFLSEKYSQYLGDFICSRYVLEHIKNPFALLSMLRRMIGDRRDMILYFEVPNVLFILRDLSIWDIIYEHCSYFSQRSLAYMFEQNGFEVLSLKETYSGQSVSVEARPRQEQDISNPEQVQKPPSIESYISRFADLFRKKTTSWRRQISRLGKAKSRVVVWGAGAKGVSFLNMLDLREEVQYAVDINPNKQGKYISGTGQKIVPPEFLGDYKPDIILIMNPRYVNEIHQMSKKIGIHAEFLLV